MKKKKPVARNPVETAGRRRANPGRTPGETPGETAGETAGKPLCVVVNPPGNFPNQFFCFFFFYFCVRFSFQVGTLVTNYRAFFSFNHSTANGWIPS